MIIRKLETRNFRRLRGDHSWTFPEGIVGIVGLNGRGKSTLVNAIAWSLFGPHGLHNRADVSTWGSDDVQVTVHFTHDDVGWMLTRTNSTAKLTSADHTVAVGLDPVTREIERLLGVDRVAFLISAFCRQDELHGISALQPAKRVETILRLLGVDDLTKAIERVKAEARGTRRELTGLRAGTGDLRNLVSELEDLLNFLEITRADLADGRAVLAEWQESHNSLIAETQIMLDKRRAWDQYQWVKSHSDIRLAQAAAQLRFWEGEIEKFGGPPPVPEADFRNLEEEVVSLRAEHARITKQMEQSERACPTCKRPFETLQNYEDLKAAWLQEISEISEHLVPLEKSLAAERQKIEQYDRFNAAMGALEKARTDLATAHEDSQRLEPVEDVSEASQALTDQVSTSSLRGDRLRENLSTLEERVRNYEERRERLERQITAGRQVEARAAALEDAAVHAETAAGELSRMKEYLTSSAIPTLVRGASALISEFTDGRYSELNLTPDYEIQFRNEIGDLKSFVNLSGGEKDIFALALRLAICDLRAESVGVLFLDEVFESLDPERQELAWSMIERLTGRYDQIFCVTHVASIKDRAPSVVAL